jgi:hypothetical protein
MRGSLPVHDLCPIETQPSRLSSSTKQAPCRALGKAGDVLSRSQLDPALVTVGGRLDHQGLSLFVSGLSRTHSKSPTLKIYLYLIYNSKFLILIIIKERYIKFNIY